MEMTGCTLGTADVVRRLVGKKKIDEMRLYANVFKYGEREEIVNSDGSKTYNLNGQYKLQEDGTPILKGAIYNGFSEHETDNVWNQIVKFAGYSFNKCLSGNTRLSRPGQTTKFQPTIAEMYKIRNDIDYARQTGHRDLRKKYMRSGYGNGLSLYQDGLIRKNQIVDIMYSGTRMTYAVTTESGRSITGTNNHKFPTPSGETELSKLTVGDSVYVMSAYDTSPRNSYNFTNGTYVSNHPTKGQQGFQSISNINEAERLYKEIRQGHVDNHTPCEMCGVGYSAFMRFELHHINDDRTNNNKGNLLWCCNSCHKKAHYQMGRTKVHMRGRETITERIVSIAEAGVEDVYDIEMAAPAHNFVIDNGIVTCNSHATAYADTAYQTAYMKYYHRAHYMGEVMTAHKLKEDLVASIKEARRLGVPILQPDINMSQGEFSIEPCNNVLGVRFGFEKIFGINNADIIVNERNANGLFKDIADYFARIPNQKWNKNKTEALIRAGCFDNILWDHTDPSKGYCINRLEVLNHYYRDIRNFKKVTPHEWKQADTKGRQNVYVEWNLADYTHTSIKFDFEYDMLGLYVSGHPVGHLPYVPWNNVPPRQNITAYGVITKFTVLTDKNKKKYARFNMEAVYDVRECIMWSTEYTQFAQQGLPRLPEGTTVEVTGRKDVSRGANGQFVINSMRVLTQSSGLYQPKKKATKKSYDGGYIPTVDGSDFIGDDG
jgi:DNA polymerase-3 subunit alpha